MYKCQCKKAVPLYCKIIAINIAIFIININIIIIINIILIITTIYIVIIIIIIIVIVVVIIINIINIIIIFITTLSGPPFWYNFEDRGGVESSTICLLYFLAYIRDRKY